MRAISIILLMRLKSKDGKPHCERVGDIERRTQHGAEHRSEYVNENETPFSIN